MLRTKNKLYRKYVLISTPLSFYNTFRNKYNHTVRSTKKQYFCKKCKKYSNNIKTTWEVTNPLMQREKKKYSELPSYFVGGEESFNSPFDITTKCYVFFFLLMLVRNECRTLGFYNWN